MTTKVTFNDYYHEFGINISGKGTIADVQKYAFLYGGSIMLVDFRMLDKDKPYRLTYRLCHPPFEFFIYDIELTEEEYQIQKDAFNGKEFVMVNPKQEIILIDNTYLLIR